MKLIRIVNELIVANVMEATHFYEKVFHFEVEYTDGNPVTWVQMKNGNVKLMLEDYETVSKEISDFPNKVKSNNIMKFELDSLTELKDLYQRCKNDNCIFFMDYRVTEYGKVEFGIFDLDYNMILVSCEQDD